MANALPSYLQCAFVFAHSNFEERMVPKGWLRLYQSNGMFDQAVCRTNDHASRMVPKGWLRLYQSNGMFDQAVCRTNDHASCASGTVSEQDRVHVSNLSTKSKLSHSG